MDEREMALAAIRQWREMYDDEVKYRVESMFRFKAELRDLAITLRQAIDIINADGNDTCPTCGLQEGASAVCDSCPAGTWRGGPCDCGTATGCPFCLGCDEVDDVS